MLTSIASPKRAVALRFLLLPCLSRGLALRPPAAAATLGAPSKKRHTLLTFGFVCTVFHGLQQQSAEDGPERPSVSDVIRRALLNPGYILESTFSPLWLLATTLGLHSAPRTVRECDFALDAAAIHAATRAHERARELFIRSSLLCPFVPCPSQFTAGSLC